MKGGKKGEELTGPLFPRLHVNDAPEKGVPRAPPRNKMALYEQLSIPSQRFGSGMGSTAPVHLSNVAACPSASSSQASGHERSLLTSFCVQQSSFHSIDKVNSRSSDGKHANVAAVTFEPKFTSTVDFKAANVPGHFSTATECNSHSHKVSKRKDLGRKQFRDEYDFMVPTFINTETVTSINKEKACNPKSSSSCTADASSAKHIVTSCNCAAQLWKSGEKFVIRPKITGKRSRQSDQITIQHGKHPVEGLQNGTAKITSSPGMEAVPLERPRSVENNRKQDGQSGSLDDVGNTYNEAGLHGGSNADLLSHDNRCSETLTEAICNINVSNAESGDSFRISNEYKSREPSANCEGCPTEKNANGKLQPDDRDKIADASETSMVVSVSGLEISPDDVVGVIGLKQFWKARRALLNQQRIFSVQVFELHRLIKVQKYFAGSPHLLHDVDLYLTIPSTKTTDNQCFPDENSRSQPPNVKQKPEPPKPSQNAKCSDHSSGKPVLTLDSIVKNGLAEQAPTHAHNDCNSSLGPTVVNSTSAPWCFPSVGTQWLFPVMSPCKGLFYKPCADPGPPVGCLMAPAHGTCLPISLPFGGDIANVAYCLPPSHGLNGVTLLSDAPNFFPPHGLHVMNPILLGSMGSEQANAQLSKDSERLHGRAQQFSAEMNARVGSQGSCNMLSRKADAFQASKETEFQGSTASTPCSHEKVQEAVDEATEMRLGSEPLPLKTSGIENSDRMHLQSREQAGRVIKVVPHNAKFATESAAKIFWSIQKEREQHDD